jgi:hypothetical protein
MAQSINKVHSTSNITAATVRRLPFAFLPACASSTVHQPQPSTTLAETACPCRYYARGTFAWPSITYYDTSGQDSRAWLTWPAFATWLALHTFLDYPLRWLSGGRLASKVAAVPASSQAYDLALGRQLWEECAAMAGLPAEVQLGEAGGAEVTEPPAGKPSKHRRSGRQSRSSS